MTDISGQHFFGKQSLSSDVVGEGVSAGTFKNTVSGQASLSDWSTYKVE
jgi:hypothetical protein